MVDRYTYRSLEPDEIRLLTITESAPSQQIYQLEHLKLEHVPRSFLKTARVQHRGVGTALSAVMSPFNLKKNPFNALFYTWDNQEPAHEIFVWDGASISIAPSGSPKTSRRLYQYFPLATQGRSGGSMQYASIRPTTKRNLPKSH